jgi:hypothetical protein
MSFFLLGQGEKKDGNNNRPMFGSEEADRMA